MNTSMWSTLQALLPYIAVQCAVTAMVFAMPWTVHQFDTAAEAIAAPISAQDLEQQMREMSNPGSPPEAKNP